jgi:hypothetical protein
LGTYNALSLSFWLKPSTSRTAGDNWPNPFGGSSSGDHYLRGDYVFSDSTYGIGSHGFCAATYSGNMTVLKNQWTHIFFEYNVADDISREYHNGVLVSVRAISCSYVYSWNTFHNELPDVYFGEGYGGSRYWDGMIDEGAIWNRTLNESEISQIYNSGNGLSLIQ